MRYKLQLSRSNEIMPMVDIPADFNMNIGNVLLIDGKYHELKQIIRPTYVVIDIKAFPTKDQMDDAMPILVIGDSFPLI